MWQGVRPILTAVRGRVAFVARGCDERALVDGKQPDKAKFPEPAIVGSVVIGACSRLTLRDLRSQPGESSDTNSSASIRDITKRSPLLGGPAEAEPPAAAARGRDAGWVKSAW